MTILYEGMIGTAAVPDLGWGLIIGSCVCLIIAVLLGINDYINEALTGICVGITIVGIIVGIFCLIDSRIPIVKATIDDNITYQEVDSKYELRKVEGKIYTFEVKNTTPDEWEMYLNK